MVKKLMILFILLSFIGVSFGYNCTSNCTFIIEQTTQEVQTNFSGIYIMFTAVSLFLAVYFMAKDRETKAKYDKAPENILIISFCWFMFIVSSYMSLLYILETGHAGDNTAYTMTTLYTLLLVVIFIFLLVKHREIFIDKLKEWGFL